MARCPEGIDERPEQLREPIHRSLGLTPSERYLARLAERTFLNLWSYPNPYRSQPVANGSAGKELCDLLVVCDPHVIVFSEKRIAWQEKPVEKAWPRWFRKAVLEAASQLRGAERWIANFPDRLFLDARCSRPFPLALPPTSRRKVHRIVVAGGAEEACRDYFAGGSGSFLIKPSIVSADHWDPKSERFQPFALGDLDPQSDFVHVFDGVSLEVLMSELDTISDFTDYLEKRARFLRSGKLAVAHGEEELLAHYATRINKDGDHDFVPPDGRSWDEIDEFGIGGGHYAAFVKNPRYIAKKRADENSYAWDRLIELFTDHMLGGTSIVLPGHSFSLTNSELAVRYMALESRYKRRSHSEAVLGALERGKSTDVFFRAMVPLETSKDNETGFFFLTLKYTPMMAADGGYERYRLFRTAYMETYAQALLMKLPYLRRVIGVAMEPPGQGHGSSEDCVYAEQMNWTEAQRDALRENCEGFGIMRDFQPQAKHFADEFPEVPKRQPSVRGSGNRQQRRARVAEARRKK